MCDLRVQFVVRSADVRSLAGPQYHGNAGVNLPERPLSVLVPPEYLSRSCAGNYFHPQVSSSQDDGFAHGGVTMGLNSTLGFWYIQKYWKIPTKKMASYIYGYIDPPFIKAIPVRGHERR